MFFSFSRWVFSLCHRIDVIVLYVLRTLTACFLPFRYNDPYSLPCLHNFCWNCITGWLNKKSECPICRAHYSVADLKKSFVLSEMVNSAQTGNSTFCDECKTSAASMVKCDHCDKSICSLCQTKHTAEVHLPEH